MEPKYHRVLLKLSGEALAGPKKNGLDTATMLPICKSIQKCVNAGVQMGIVVGGCGDSAAVCSRRSMHR